MKNRFKKGFGLLEVLVSAVIIIMILSALVLIGRKSLSNSVYAQQRAQAIYASQEGLEIIRQMRDTNWIDGNSNTQWDSMGIDSAGKLVNLTDLDSNQIHNAQIQFYTQASNPANRYYLLLADNSAGAQENIGYSLDGITTLFEVKRSVTIEKTNPYDLLPGLDPETKSANALKITVTTKWDYDGSTHTVNVSEILTNWRPNY